MFCSLHTTEQVILFPEENIKLFFKNHGKGRTALFPFTFTGRYLSWISHFDHPTEWPCFFSSSCLKGEERGTWKSKWTSSAWRCRRVDKRQHNFHWLYKDSLKKLTLVFLYLEGVTTFVKTSEKYGKSLRQVYFEPERDRSDLFCYVTLTSVLSLGSMA